MNKKDYLIAGASFVLTFAVGLGVISSVSNKKKPTAEAPASSSSSSSSSVDDRSYAEKYLEEYFGDIWANIPQADKEALINNLKQTLCEHENGFYYVPELTKPSGKPFVVDGFHFAICKDCRMPAGAPEMHKVDMETNLCKCQELPPHEHNYELTYDSYYHWSECECGDVIYTSRVEHTFINGECECGAVE